MLSATGNYGWSTTYFAEKNKFYHIVGEFTATSETMTVNGTVVLTRTWSVTGTPSSNACFYYFTRHSSDTAKAPMKLYRSRIWKNGVLAGDFIPAIRRSNNAKCVCNLLTKTFHGYGNFDYEYLN